VSIINYSAPRRLLVVARGHPYERQPFADLFQGLDEFDTCFVEQPAALSLLTPSVVRDYDAVVCYDMPGVDFSKGTGVADSVAPDELWCEGLLDMLESGIGMLFLHHSLASWPAWDTWAEIIGGRFHYTPATLRGKKFPDSGYRHKVAHTLTVQGDHPVTEGLPTSFDMVDELYLCPVFEDEVVPLLRSDYDFSGSNFYSAAAAVAGRMNERSQWNHPDGSNLVGWAKNWGNSPLVYLQGGDDAEAMGSTHYRQLVHNSIRWLASEPAREWARAQNHNKRTNK
jgi:uncharacterized protein